MVLRKLISRSSKHFGARPLKCEVFGIDPVGNLKFSGSPVLLVYDSGNVFPH